MSEMNVTDLLRPSTSSEVLFQGIVLITALYLGAHYSVDVARAVDRLKALEHEQFRVSLVSKSKNGASPGSTCVTTDSATKGSRDPDWSQYGPLPRPRSTSRTWLDALVWVARAVAIAALSTVICLWSLPDASQPEIFWKVCAIYGLSFVVSQSKEMFAVTHDRLSYSRLAFIHRPYIAVKLIGVLDQFFEADLKWKWLATQITLFAFFCASQVHFPFVTPTLYALALGALAFKTSLLSFSNNMGLELRIVRTLIYIGLAIAAFNIFWLSIMSLESAEEKPSNPLLFSDSEYVCREFEIISSMILGPLISAVRRFEGARTSPTQDDAVILGPNLVEIIDDNSLGETLPTVAKDLDSSAQNGFIPGDSKFPEEWRVLVNLTPLRTYLPTHDPSIPITQRLLGLVVLSFILRGLCGQDVETGTQSTGLVSDVLSSIVWILARVSPTTLSVALVSFWLSVKHRRAVRLAAAVTASAKLSGLLGESDEGVRVKTPEDVYLDLWAYQENWSNAYLLREVEPC